MIKLNLIKKNLDYLEGQKLTAENVQDLKHRFYSEQLEEWVVAAKTIGRLAALRGGELKDFLQEMLIDYDNIHRQRHALTALGSYYFYCDDETEKFKFLRQYKDYHFYDSNKQLELAEITEEKSLEDFIGEIINTFYEYNLLCNCFKQGGSLTNKEISLLEKVNKNIYYHKADVIAALCDSLDLERSKIAGAKDYYSLIAKIGDIYDLKSIEKTVDFLQEETNTFFHKAVSFYRLEKFLEASIDKKVITGETAKDLNLYYGLLNPRFPLTWYVASLTTALFEIAKKRADAKSFLQDLIDRGEEEIEYLVNLPLFFFFLETEESKLDFSEFETEFKNLSQAAVKLINRNTNKYEEIHIPDLLLDLEYLWDQFYEKEDFISFLENKNNLIKEDVVRKYGEIKKYPHQAQKRQQTLHLIEEIKGYFSDEIKWNSLPLGERNTKIIFSMLIGRRSGNLSVEDKRKILLAEIDKIKGKNDELLNLLLRELKEFYFNDLKGARNNNKLAKTATFQIYSLLGLIKEWNWTGVINKDLATMVINVLDALWRDENYQQVFKLAFLFFNALPETRIASEVVKYTKNKKLSDLLNVYVRYNLSEQHHQGSVTDFKVSIEKIKGILKEAEVDSEIIDFYSMMEKLLFKKESSCNYKTRQCDFSDILADNQFNLFNINCFIEWEKSELNCGDCSQEKNRFRINKLENRDYRLLKKYIFKPSIKYNFFKEKGVLSFLNLDSKQQQKEINRRIDHLCKNYLNDLKEVISSLDIEQDNYFSAFNDSREFSDLDNVIRRILNLLKDYHELMDKLPIFERDYIFAALEEAEDFILLAKEQISKINIACKAEAETELLNNVKDDFADFRIETKPEQDPLELSKELKKCYQGVIYDNFLNRGMFNEYNLLLEGKDISLTDKLLTKINQTLTKGWLFLIIFLLPALFYTGYKLLNFWGAENLARSFWNISLGIYFNYILLSQVILLAVFVVVIFKLLNRFIKPVVKKRRQEGYKFTFFLPKLLGVIFIIYLNFSLDGFLIVATNQTTFFLKVVLLVIYLVFIYYFLKTFQFSTMRMKADKKRKRIFNIMTIGLFYSFLINLLFKVVYSYGTKIMHSEDLKMISEKVLVVEKIASHPGQEIIDLTAILNSLLVSELVIMPELIIFWTGQMLFIAIVLEFFLQREKIIEK